MKVLVACEYSGRVRDAFLARGHDAMSCDFLDTESPGPHYKGNVLDILDEPWDLMIAHPECTRLTLAGVRWLYHPDDTSLKPELRRRHPDYPGRMSQLIQDCEFFNTLKTANIPKICIENSQPHGLAMSMVGRYDQKVQPWMFGEPYTKGACLWLKGLPELAPTHEKPDKVIAACHKESPGVDRWKNRSRTYQAIAAAMAQQWG